MTLPAASLLHAASVLSTCECVSSFCLRHTGNVKLHCLGYLVTWLQRLTEGLLPWLSPPLAPFSFRTLHVSFPRNLGKRESLSTFFCPTLEREAYTLPYQDYLWDLFNAYLLSTGSQAAITEPLNQMGRGTVSDITLAAGLPRPKPKWSHSCQSLMLPNQSRYIKKWQLNNQASSASVLGHSPLRIWVLWGSSEDLLTINTVQATL